MKYRVLLLAALLFILASSLIAQEENDTSNNQYDYRHAVGANIGETTGKGLVYRYSFDKFSAQVGFLPVITDFNTDSDVSGSLSFYYRIKEYKNINLKLYQGTEYQYTRGYEYSDIGYYPPVGHLKTHHYINTSLGFGIDILLGNRASINLLLGYTAIENFAQLKVKGEAGVFFHF